MRLGTSLHINRIDNKSGGAVETRFITEFTVGAGESITLPLILAGSYNFTVDYGDGTGIKDVTAYDDADRIHDYTAAGAGTYTVIIIGTCDRWNFDTVPTSKDKLTKIVNLGDVGWFTFEKAFQLCGELISCEGGVVDNVISTVRMFASCPKMIFHDSTGWNTGNVENMNAMYIVCSLLSSLPGHSSWDTSKVLDMNFMFYKNFVLLALNLSLWDTSKVLNMSSMLRSCTLLITFGSLDMTAVTNAVSMVAGATNLFDSLFINVNVSFSLLNLNYNAAALEAAADAAGDGTGQTVTLTGNPGAATFDDSVFLAKNWTVAT